MIKYYYLNKEHAMLGEVIVRKTSIVPLSAQSLDNEFGDNNWVEYQHEGDNLPPYLKYDNNTKSWSTTPPENFLVKHMYMGIDALEGVYHEGNLDLSQILSSKPFFNNTIESFAEMALSYPWQSYINTFDSKNNPTKLLYIGQDNDRVKVTDDKHDVEVLRDLYVKGRIYSNGTVNSKSDVEATAYKSDGSEETVSLLKLKSAFDDLSAAVKAFMSSTPADGTPIGAISTFTNFEDIPLDYLICDGREFDTSLFPDLYRILKTNRVPDMRGMFQRMLDLGRGIDHEPFRNPLSYQRDNVTAGNAYNIGVIYAIKATYSSKDTDYSKILRFIVSMLVQKYDKSGGTVNGSMLVSGNLNATGTIRGVSGSFSEFNDLSEYVNTSIKYDKLILSLYDFDKEEYKPCLANDAIYTIGVSVDFNDTGMIIGQAKNDNESLVALKGRVYVKCDDYVSKGDKLYLSNINPGFASTIPNKHYIGFAVTDSINGQVRVLVKN